MTHQSLSSQYVATETLVAHYPAGMKIPSS